MDDWLARLLDCILTVLALEAATLAAIIIAFLLIGVFSSLGH